LFINEFISYLLKIFAIEEDLIFIARGLAAKVFGFYYEIYLSLTLPK